MNHRKGELKRLTLICTAIELFNSPSKEEIRQYVSSHGYSGISTSQIEKDMALLKKEFDVPIEYSKAKRGYYYTDYSFKFWKALLIYFSSYVEFPKFIKKELFDQ